MWRVSVFPLICGVASEQQILTKLIGGQISFSLVQMRTSITSQMGTNVVKLSNWNKCGQILKFEQKWSRIMKQMQISQFSNFSSARFNAMQLGTDAFLCQKWPNILLWIEFCFPDFFCQKWPKLTFCPPDSANMVLHQSCQITWIGKSEGGVRSLRHKWGRRRLTAKGNSSFFCRIVAALELSFRNACLCFDTNFVCMCGYVLLWDICLYLQHLFITWACKSCFGGRPPLASSMWPTSNFCLKI